MPSTFTAPKTPFVSSACSSTAPLAPALAPRVGRLELGLVAAGAVSVPHDEIDGWRRKAPVVAGASLAPGFLKPVDEQTVCCYLAVAQAMQEAGLDGGSFKEWGVLAAPRFLGRVFDAGTFHKFLQIGGGGVSVHLIPQQSQHAVSGAISVAFGMQGPNFGIAGGPRGLAEALLVGFSAYDPSVVPGLWLLLSEFDPEATPDRAGKHTTPAVCHALALALSLDAAHHGPQLALQWELSGEAAREVAPQLTVANLSGPLVTAARGIVRDAARWDLGGGFRLEVAANESR